jgi:predicted nuclease with TOPRIM domain
MKTKIERHQNEHHKLKDAYKCLEVEKLKLKEKDNCRDKKLHETMEEVKALDEKVLFTRFFESFLNPGPSSMGSMKAILNDICAEKESLQKKVDCKTSELTAIETKVTAIDDEVKLLEDKLFKLQVVLEQERQNHGAEMQHQSAETA